MTHRGMPMSTVSAGIELEKEESWWERGVCRVVYGVADIPYGDVVIYVFILGRRGGFQTRPRGLSP